MTQSKQTTTVDHVLPHQRLELSPVWQEHMIMQIQVPSTWSPRSQKISRHLSTHSATEEVLRVLKTKFLPQALWAQVAMCQKHLQTHQQSRISLDGHCPRILDPSPQWRNTTNIKHTTQEAVLEVKWTARTDLQALLTLAAPTVTALRN